MAVLRKLYQPILYWHYKFHRISLLKQIPNTRKSIPLNIIIAENTDIYEKMKTNMTNAEWQNIREKFLQIQQITSTTVDSTIIDMCLKQFQVDNAITYFKFLRENNYPLNVAVIGKYLRLYVLKRNVLTDADKIEIVKTYNALREKHPYLDSVTAEYCIESLCLTDQWEKSFEIIEILKITTVPGTSIYSALIDAAFRNGKPDIAWKALSKIALRKLIPQDVIYTSHLQYCKSEKTGVFDSRMKEMFNFWSEYSIMPYNRIISAYADAANKHGWSTAPTTISKKGKCKHCGHSLSEVIISEKSFRKLAECVMNRVIIGSDIYRKTNPRELLKFKTFVDNTKPYDIVIDGLNITYIQNQKSLERLVEVVKDFSKDGKKILVLTRRHQKNLSTFKYIEQYALVFLLNNLSDDDPYMLYATMASGKNTMFISSDLMRQHKNSLKDPRLQQEFKKWQCSHQYRVRISATDFHILQPFVYLLTAQENDGHWHIPYVTDNFTYAESYEFPDKWYCLKHNKQK